jgi:gag-polypeptide of LTR copia-type
MLIEEHIRTLHGYQEELHSLGQKIEGEEFCIILLTSLPESWNNYIASIDTMDIKDTSKLIAHILEHDRQLNLKNSDDMALAEKGGKKKVNPNITAMDAVKRGTSVSSARRSPNQEKGNWEGSRRRQWKPMQWWMRMNLYFVERTQHWLFH